MKILLQILFLALTSNVLKAQIFDKRLLDEKVKQIDSVYKFRETLYVIDGIPYENYDTTKIDSVLSSKGLKYLLTLDILNESVAANLISCRPIREIVLVTFAHRQESKKKRNLFKKVKQSFVDNYISFSQHIVLDSKDPVLYINNGLVHHTEAKQKINSLTFKGVYYIDYNDKAVSLEHYGKNAKNGLIRIWTVPQ